MKIVKSSLNKIHILGTRQETLAIVGGRGFSVGGDYSIPLNK